VEFIINVNNENLSTINFTKLISPINRITSSVYGLFYRVLVHMLPDLVFIIVISGYFFYKNIPFGLFFLFANFFLLLYMFTGWSEVLTIRREYEEESNNSEKYLIEILNNMEKIIFRGKGKDEIDSYSNKTTSSNNFEGSVFSYNTSSGTLEIDNITNINGTFDLQVKYDVTFNQNIYRNYLVYS
jgi:ABC-type transport system involved in Fe-S cluster assembly fused permease/ATPase subunit